LFSNNVSIAAPLIYGMLGLSEKRSQFFIGAPTAILRFYDAAAT
jgi:hypothetical protein